MLGEREHRLLEAADGREGLAVARAEHPDLVITDVLMPVMDGYEFMMELSRDAATAHIPVVFWTAHYGAREARALAVAGGVFDVLTKPVDARTLLSVVHSALSGHSGAGRAGTSPSLAPAFDREHLHLVTTKLSDTMGDLRAANARLRAVINIGLDFAAEHDIDRLLQTVCVALHDLFAAASATLGVVDRSGQTVERLVTCDASAVAGVRVGDAVTGVHRTVVAERRTVRGDQFGGPLPLAEPVLGAEPHAFVIAPIASGTHVHGWVSLVGNEGKHFTDDDESLLVALGGLIGRTYELGHLSQHDFLTGLPNRQLLEDRVAQAIGAARRTRQNVAVLFVDLDRFKQVNDSLGHLIGDLLLQSVARRLVNCLRSSDTVSRHGGDEFVVLLSRIENADDAVTAAEKLIGALAPPHVIEHQQLHLSATIGISMYPGDSTTGETLIRCADLAMYQAKKDRQPYRFFEPAMNARALERQRLEADLHGALERHEFVLHYQPRVDLPTGRLVGAEALIRWVHPRRGLMLPGDFVPVAEDCGLMVPIGRWVLTAACAQARAWRDDGRQPVVVAVNISACELRDARLVDHVRAVMQSTGLDPCWLELELTESALMQHVASTVLTLHALKDMGVELAIDDFGTGYSSLSYLRQFPVSALKIDRSFVRGITAAPVDTAIVRAVISLGKSLGHRVVAEGVETREELAFLRSQQCDEGQGYYFSPPLAAEHFLALLGTDSV
jgi:diguanylate cyclase (GGDEF)-like protein